jgi:CBS-domain-containing membrane protein
MSARAAWRLASLSFAQVFRYTAGKADWSAYGLPTEGKSVTLNRAGNLVRRDVPTCSLSDRADAIRQLLHTKEATLCAVLNEHRVLLGEVSAKKVESAAHGTAEEIMTSAPTTIRPNATLEKLCEFFKAHKAETLWVTTNDGELLGLVHRADVKRAAPKDEEPACMH